MPETTTSSQYARIDQRLMLAVDREERLPAWARQLIGDLRRTVARLEGERDAARFATDPDASDTLLDFYKDPPIGLGRSTPVRFVLSEGRRPSYVEVRTRDGQAVLSGSSPLMLRMDASNVVRVSVE